MKKIFIIIALIMLSLASYAQFELNGQVYNLPEYNEIYNDIYPEIEAQARQEFYNWKKSQSQTNQRQTQTTQQQAIQNYNNRISTEGQARMEHLNNPDVYIDREITNRSTSPIVIPDDRYVQSTHKDTDTKNIILSDHHTVV